MKGGFYDEENTNCFGGFEKNRREKSTMLYDEEVLRKCLQIASQNGSFFITTLFKKEGRL